MYFYTLNNLQYLLKRQGTKLLYRTTTSRATSPTIRMPFNRYRAVPILIGTRYTTCVTNGLFSDKNVYFENDIKIVWKEGSRSVAWFKNKALSLSSGHINISIGNGVEWQWIGDVNGNTKPKRKFHVDVVNNGPLWSYGSFVNIHHGAANKLRMQKRLMEVWYSV